MVDSEAETFLKDISHNSGFVRKEGTGDLDTIEGMENYRQALLRRLITVPGSLVHRPEYGVGIKLYQNAPNTLATQREMAMKVEEQFLRDIRTEAVLGVAFEYDDLTAHLVTITARVKPAGRTEVALQFTPFGEVA